eukprot:CAMPEP_0115138556 /NCGR_PEP_ID=MMETSP0227-20121206/57739_1 /TAXON_ID=89957 /ORGANISM="Polarella glacialis, Strain CCMP 1383" /LENGTH=90 /DNA_ID=CAMNT_0002546203 /DNA_START=165 /DNA_END=433 /DNA_ORIENTATION=+
MEMRISFSLPNDAAAFAATADFSCMAKIFFSNSCTCCPFPSRSLSSPDAAAAFAAAADFSFAAKILSNSFLEFSTTSLSSPSAAAAFAAA